MHDVRPKEACVQKESRIFQLLFVSVYFFQKAEHRGCERTVEHQVLHKWPVQGVSRGPGFLENQHEPATQLGAIRSKPCLIRLDQTDWNWDI